MPMSKYQRKEQILDYIEKNKSCSTDELISHFEVSVSTSIEISICWKGKAGSIKYMEKYL